MAVEPTRRAAHQGMAIEQNYEAAPVPIATALGDAVGGNGSGTGLTAEQQWTG